MNCIYNRVSSYALIIVVTVMIGLIPLAGAKAEWTPTYAPSINVTKLSGEIKIDGYLSEDIWKQVGASNDFTERYPGDMIQPPVKTEVYVAYDNAKLYVGFIAHDDPANLRATMCQRDQFSGDDFVAVFLDTYGNAAWTYEFYVNPYGIQRDRLLTYVGSTIQQDYGFDMIWESAAKITTDGYSAEIAIPFSSIRFPNNDGQSWKVNFERFHPRDINHIYSWAAFDRNEQCTPCQYGTLSGMTNIQPGKGFEVLPAMVAQQVGYYDGVDFYNEDADGEMALTGKYSINSDVTLEAALNPDFSQIE